MRPSPRKDAARETEIEDRRSQIADCRGSCFELQPETCDVIWERAMDTRRAFLLKTGVGVLGLPLAAHELRAGDREKLPDGSASKDMIIPEAQRAIDKGLSYL